MGPPHTLGASFSHEERDCTTASRGSSESGKHIFLRFQDTWMSLDKHLNLTNRGVTAYGMMGLVVNQSKGR